MQQITRPGVALLPAIVGLGAIGTGLAGPAQALAHAATPAVRIAGFPSVEQWYNLSCEYAAAAAVTLYWGNLVSQRTFLREVPNSPNPHRGFRGDIHGSGGGLNNYGIYAEPLVPVLERRGYNAD